MFQLIAEQHLFESRLEEELYKESFGLRIQFDVVFQVLFSGWK